MSILHNNLVYIKIIISQLTTAGKSRLNTFNICAKNQQILA